MIMKTVKLNKKELDKFIQVLGVYRVKILWCENKIKISNDLLNYLCSLKEDDKKF